MKKKLPVNSQGKHGHLPPITTAQSEGALPQPDGNETMMEAKGMTINSDHQRDSLVDPT